MGGKALKKMYLSLEAQKVVHGMHMELPRIRLSLKLKNMVVYEKLRSRGIFLGLRFFQERYYNASTTNFFFIDVPSVFLGS